MPRCILRAPMPMQPPERSDAELIQACRRGEEAAWEALVRKYRRLVYSIPHRGGLTVEEGSDVFQTVFLALMRSLETLHQEQTLIPWLMTTAKRETWKVRRKRAREVPEDDAHSDPSSPEDSPEAPLEQLERQVAVRTALDRSDPRCRRLLEVLFYSDPVPSYAEIARSLGIAVPSIGPTRIRCLDKLHRELKRGGHF